jgi:acetylglutamate kinase
MVLGGRVNKSLVSLIQQAGGRAVGLCGKDGDLLRARQVRGTCRRRTSAAGPEVGLGPAHRSADVQHTSGHEAELRSRGAVPWQRCSVFVTLHTSPHAGWLHPGCSTQQPTHPPLPPAPAWLQMVEKDIGYVGEVTRVNPTILNSLVKDNYIPVVATVATDGNGQALNVNADTAAGEVSGGRS